MSIDQFLALDHERKTAFVMKYTKATVKPYADGNRAIFKVCGRICAFVDMLPGGFKVYAGKPSDTYLLRWQYEADQRGEALAKCTELCSTTLTRYMAAGLV